MRTRHLVALLAIIFSLLITPAGAQTVTRTQHRAAIAKDAVTTGTMTIRKPDYISITTDQGREQLIMDGTKFTITLGGKQHTTDSRKNAQFATFHAVLTAVVNGQPIPQSDETKVTTKGGSTVITVTPAGKKKRQLFTSFVLTVNARTKAFSTLRMNGRGEDYITYEFK
ncbi:MAG: outer membrane lipoprotein carrier protein LolA [Prevotella sp.]|nr:outer membrane lipoprotein carrier protein LolA [Prevotella sp.]